MNLLRDPQKLAPLQEVTTIAVGNAATALAKLTDQEVTVSVPSVKLLSVEKVPAEVGPTTQPSTVALVRIEGDAKGILMFSFDPKDARTTAEQTNRQLTGGEFVDDHHAVLREMTNIVAGTMLSAIGKFLNLELTQSVPDSATDMLGAVIDPLTAELGADYDEVLVLQEVFTMPAQGSSLKLLGVIDPPSTIFLLEQLANKVSPTHGTNN
jgi:chemotaxis protein CheC